MDRSKIVESILMSMNKASEMNTAIINRLIDVTLNNNIMIGEKGYDTIDTVSTEKNIDDVDNTISNNDVKELNRDSNDDKESINNTVTVKESIDDTNIVKESIDDTVVDKTVKSSLEMKIEPPKLKILVPHKTRTEEQQLKVGSLFAGIGGICLGFKQAGFDIIYANEFNSKSCTTYRANFGSEYLKEEDILNVSGEYMPNINILTAGFPCQPFSLFGKLKGFDDERGTMFFEIMRLIDEKETIGEKPEVLFFENVRNLMSHDKGETFKVIIECIKKRGYLVKYRAMNTTNYANIPHNRDRIFIVGFLDRQAYDNFSFPLEIPLTRNIHEFLEPLDEKQDDKYYYTAENTVHYEKMKTSITDDTKLYRYDRNRVSANINGNCPCLVANDRTSVPIALDKHGIRRITERECLRFQGFPENYIIPDNVHFSHIYVQAGNSVTVTVIERIAIEIKKALKKKKKCIIDGEEVSI
jgi:DNA (cytosine-5)-methyltransferase 1